MPGPLKEEAAANGLSKSKEQRNMIHNNKARRRISFKEEGEKKKILCLKVAASAVFSGWLFHVWQIPRFRRCCVRSQKRQTFSLLRSVLVNGLLVASVTAQGIFAQTTLPSCPPKPILLQPTTNNNGYKEKYFVGVLAIRGFDAAYTEFNSTFSEYLTATAGARFDPPITFGLKPLNFNLLFTDTENRIVDFIYVNPSAYSCIESEYGAHTLVSQISLRKVSGKSFDLTKFGGVVFSRADNNNITSISDIKNQRVACASISGLGSGQMQFRLLQQAGLSYINDPKMMVFTSNQGKVVNGVLSGEFDVGYVRTDQIERTKDATTGQLVKKSDFKVIEPQPNLNIDGVPFPFESSTLLYPEWNVGSLAHVPNEIAIEVQHALLQLADHASIGADITQCYNTENCSGTNDFLNQDECERNCQLNSIQDGQCSLSTVDIALLAHRAKTDGKYTGFRSTLSYMELRNMQEETSFIRRNATTGAMSCIRSSTIYDAIVCPEGHFKKSEQEVSEGCQQSGLVCGDGYQCVCSPCAEGFDVDVVPFKTSCEAGKQLGSGCAKMDLCGCAQQTKQIVYRAMDNKKRDNITMKVRAREGENEWIISASSVHNETYTYEFVVEATRVGVILLEIFIDEAQIPESPLRLQVDPRDCATDTGDILRVPDGTGSCVCNGSSVEMGSKCVSFRILFPCLFVPIGALIFLFVFLYVEKKRKQADSVWEVKPSELHFDDPPVIVGRGTFGLVVLAEYRGTQVAVKRVIPPKENQRKKKRAVDSGEISVNSVSNGGASKLDSLELNYVRKHEEKQSDTVIENTPKDFGRAQRRRSSGGNNSLGTLEEDSEPNRPSTFTRRKSLLLVDPQMFNFQDDVETAAPKRTNDGTVDGMVSGALNNITKPKRRGSLGSLETRKTFEKRQSNEGIATAASGAFSTASTSGSGSVEEEDSSFIARWLNMRWGARNGHYQLKSDFIVEMRHLSKLRHPCITTVMGAVISKWEEPMLVMEYMEFGSLYDLLHNETMVIEGALVLPILKDIVQGMRFLHAATPLVIHGDLKAQNVLVDSKFRAKVADFGLSQKKRVGATGTPLWMAPELLRGESENTAASDVYSFGIILYEVYSRRDPYEGENHRDVLRLVADPTVNKRPPVPAACPPAVATIMMDCLDANASHRPSFEELDLRLKRLDIENVEPGQMLFSKQSKKQERSDKLLYEVFPKHVADALREGRKVEPESRDSVTIFFSDIVGFTTLSSTISAQKVSNMLDRLYLKFDSLSHIHDVFKVETIGDAYLAITNLVKDQDDHTKRIAEFAVDAMEAAKKTLIDLEDEAKGFVSIRVGFHSGPVVADVVGSRNPKYTLFGDTVNTASRMESTSEEGRIQCSERSASLLKQQAPNMPLLARGSIKVKGKGEMHTFWVNEGTSATPVMRKMTSVASLRASGTSVSLRASGNSVSLLNGVSPASLAHVLDHT